MQIPELFLDEFLVLRAELVPVLFQPGFRLGATVLPLDRAGGFLNELDKHLKFIRVLGRFVQQHEDRIGPRGWQFNHRVKGAFMKLETQVLHAAVPQPGNQREVENGENSAEKERRGILVDECDLIERKQNAENE